MSLSMDISDEIEVATIVIDETKRSPVGTYLRNFLVGLWRRDPGTLSVYQS